MLGHVVLLFFVIVLGWNIAEESTPQTTPVITATIDQSPLEPLGEIETEQVAAAALELEPLKIPEMAETGTSLLLPSDSALPAGSLRGAAPSGLGRVSFVGLGGGVARRIVYVVDASGSMIGAFPVVLTELRKSIDNLTEAQSFSIVFFQRDEAVETPPNGRLIQATLENKETTAAWIHDNITPSGRSSPMNALEKAMALKPEVIYLLSSNITGSGRYEIDTEALMAGLETLNPVEADRRRKTIINCVQFLDEDPLGALKMIARRHGGEDDEVDNEANAYRFLDRSELGLGPIRDDTTDPAGSTGRP